MSLPVERLEGVVHSLIEAVDTLKAVIVEHGTPKGTGCPPTVEAVLALMRAGHTSRADMAIAMGCPEAALKELIPLARLRLEKEGGRQPLLPVSTQPKTAIATASYASLMKKSRSELESLAGEALPTSHSWKVEACSRLAAQHKAIHPLTLWVADSKGGHRVATDAEITQAAATIAAR